MPILTRSPSHRSAVPSSIPQLYSTASEYVKVYTLNNGFDESENAVHSAEQDLRGCGALEREPIRWMTATSRAPLF